METNKKSKCCNANIKIKNNNFDIETYNFICQKCFKICKLK